MSHRAAKLSLVMPDTAIHAAPDAETAKPVQHYPRVVVTWCTLAFCLSFWAMILLAVEQITA